MANYRLKTVVFGLTRVESTLFSVILEEFTIMCFCELLEVKNFHKYLNSFGKTRFYAS